MSGDLAASKRAGRNAEHYALDAIDPLTSVPGDEHWDAVAETAIFPSDRLPMVGICLVEAGAFVEIKSTMAVYGSGQRRGRFKLRKTQHEALVENLGVYLFAVCEPRPSRPLIAMKIVPARTVGHLVEDVASWRDEGDGRSRKAQLTWTNLFTRKEVSP